MLEVLSAVTGESIAVFEEVDFAEGSVKALKQRLAQKIGVPRFRLRLLQDNCPLDDDQTLIDDETCTLQVVQLVILEFQPPDREQDQGIMVACRGKWWHELLERHLNQPRNPNFEDANAMTPLCVASLNGSLKCVSLLIEAGANKDQGTTDDGATPLYIAAQEGHLEVVRFLVESGANKDQGTDRWWSNASLHSSSGRAPWSCPISGGVRCQQRPRQDRQWNDASLHSSLAGAPWSCPISGWVRCQQRPRHHRWLDQRLFT